MRVDLTTVAALLASLAVLAPAAPPAAAQSAATGWLQGPGAIGDNTYDGFIDSPAPGASINPNTNLQVAGWFVDHEAEGWAGADAVQVWLGTMPSGKMLANALVAQNRPDVAAALGNPYWAASGFLSVLPGSAIPAGAQTLSVYLHTGKGWWYKLVSVTGGSGGPAAAAPAAPAPSSAPAAAAGPALVVTAPREGEDVLTRLGKYTIQGTVNDPANIDTVDVWINGERDGQGGSDLGTTTTSGDGSWSLVFVPTHWPSTHANIYVYAHNKTTGQTIETVRGFNISDKRST